jgi:hypothetical protein
LGFNFGKQEDAHRLERKKENLDKPVSDIETPPKKRKRTNDDEDEDLGLPKVKTRGMLVESY